MRSLTPVSVERPRYTLLAGLSLLAVLAACGQSSRDVTSPARVDAPSLAKSGTAPSGGTGGGGTNSGGSAPAAGTPCAEIPSFTVVPGYRPSSNGQIAAVWTSFTVKNCSTGTQTVTTRMAERIVSTGAPGLTLTYQSTLAPGAQFSPGTIDDDLAQLAQTYQVTLTVTASDGSVLAQRSATATTPAQKSQTGVGP